ncbi:MAG TPA: hypothetical protein VGD65_11225 [Chryseosolibacter sp.]
MNEEQRTLGEYVYLGDRNTDERLKGKTCAAVRRADGKCIRGKNGSMLVTFGNTKMVVVGRLLRKTVKIGAEKIQDPNPKAKRGRAKL